jgi:hypothetical protein
VNRATASISAERSRDAGFAPQARGLFDQSCISALPRQQFRPGLGNFGEPTFEGFGYTGMQRAARLAQQSAVSCILYECVLKQVSRLWGCALSKEQSGLNKALECRIKLHLRRAHHGGKEGMRELSSNRRADLRHLFGRSKAVETGHQRGV